MQNPDVYCALRNFLILSSVRSRHNTPRLARKQSTGSERRTRKPTER